MAASPYTISATLAPAGVLGNYNITYNTAEFTINRKDASVTPNAASKTYGSADPAFTGTLVGFLAADGVSVTYSRTSGETVAGSPYKISGILAPAGVLGNYNISYNTADFTIEKKDASVTPNAASKTYGSADPAFTGTLAGFLAGDGVTATYSRTGGETVAGSPYTISATLSPAGVLGNYNITYNAAEFTINRKDASVTPNAASKTYGSIDPAFTGTLLGFLAGDGVTATYGRTSGETVAGSPYTISASLSPAGVLGNYNITYNTADFTIEKKDASVTPNPASKTYGEVDPALTGALAGFLTGDGVTAIYSRTSGEMVAGSPYTISAILTPAGVLGNYNITYYTADFTISKRSATVTADDKNKTYGDANPVLTATVTGTVNGDVLNYTLATTAVQFSNVNNYPITVTLGSNPNYDITPTDGTLTINRRAATVTADDKSKTYGDANPSFTATVTGTVNGDVLNYTLATTAVQFSNVAGYPITVTLGSNPNYDVTPHNGTLTVNKRQLDITANSRSKTYGDSLTFAGTEFMTGSGQLVSSDAVTSVMLTSTGAAATATVAGSPYAITPSGAVGMGLSNYTITYHDGQLSVNPKGLDITANNRSKTYGDTVTFAGTEFTTVMGQLVNGDTVTSVTLTSAGAAATATTAGSPYAITPSAAMGTGLGNYAISYHNAPVGFTVNPKGLDITANDRSKTYGQAVTFAGTEFTVGPGQLVVGDTVTSVTLTSAGAAATANVVGSPYVITPSAAVGTGLGNYTISYHNAPMGLTVSKAALTIKADDKTIVLHAALPTFTVTPTGLVNGETLAVLGGSLTFTPTTTPANAGAYDIVPSGYTSNNYTITLQKGTLSVMYSASCIISGDPTHVILQPINADGSSVNKAGSTVPAKFRVTDANCNSIGTPGVVTAFKLIGQSSDPSAVINEEVVSTTPDTAFRWDPSAQQWIFNISTKGMKAGVKYTYQITLNDGSSIVFSFALK